jgi:hypothetical protein
MMGDGTVQPENDASPEAEPVLRLSAKAARKGGVALTDAEIEEAEAEAEAWARRVNSCCGAEGL